MNLNYVFINDRKSDQLKTLNPDLFSLNELFKIVFKYNIKAIRNHSLGDQIRSWGDHIQ